MSFPQSLVLGSFSSQMKSYLSGCLISPRLSITVYPWPSKLHLQNSSVLSLRAKWLLSSGYFFKVSQVPQTSNFQNETVFLPNPLLFLYVLLLQWTGWSIVQAKNLDIILDSSLSITLTIYQSLCPVTFAFYLNSLTSLHPRDTVLIYGPIISYMNYCKSF